MKMNSQKENEKTEYGTTKGKRKVLQVKRMLNNEIRLKS